MKMCLPYDKTFYIHCCKNIFWYEDSFAYEKYLKKTLIGMKIHLHMKNILYTALKTLIGMKICLRMKNI